MQEFLEAIGPRHLVMVAGAFISALFIAGLTHWHRLFRLVVGIFVAWVFTDGIIEYFKLDPSLDTPVAGALAVFGYDAVRIGLQISKDPVKAWKFWRSHSK